MSEFLAEAQVLIRPNTAAFRATMIAELEAATRGVVVPVQVAAAVGAKATAGAAASSSAAATATKDLTAARTAQVAADLKAADSAALVAKAEQLNSVALERVAAISQAGAQSTTALAAARAQLRAANAAVAASEKAVAVGVASADEATRILTVDTLAYSVAAQDAALAAEKETVAQLADASAAKANAASHEQLSRGVATAGLSAFGLRGATLAASSSFLIGAASIEILKKSLEEASAESEAAARATAVFGNDVKGLEEQAGSFASTIGLSTTQTLKFEGAIGQTLATAGIARKELAGLSEELTKRGVDIAVRNNADLATTLQSVQLAIAGNSRGLRRYGVELGLATVNAEALRESGKRRTNDLTREDRVQARVNLILEQTASSAGAAEQRSGSLAQETRKLNAEFQNTGAVIGRIVTPALVTLITDLNKSVSVVTSLKDALAKVAPATSDGEHHATLFGKALHYLGEAEAFAAVPTLGLYTAINAIRDALRHNTAETDTNARAQLNLGDALGQLVTKFENLVVVSTRLDLKNANKELGQLAENLTKVKIAGGGPGAQIGVLDQAIAVARRAVHDADELAKLRAGTPGAGTAVANRRKQESILLTLLDQRKQLAQQEAQDAKNVADTIAKIVEDAAQRVKDAIDKANQDFVDKLTAQTDQQNLSALRAQGTKSLVDDIAAEKASAALIRQQIVAVEHSILPEKEKEAKIRELTAARIETNNAIKADQQQQALNRQQRNNQKFDRAAESIDLDIQLAQTNKNNSAEIKARQRRIRLDEARLAAVKGDTIAAKKLRNDIATQRAAIKDLRGEVDARNRDLLALEFSFLQAQQGFATNLISNLIPHGSTAGLVGSSGGGGSAFVTPTGPSGGGGGGLIDLGPSTPPDVRDVASSLGESAQTTAGPKGATTGQMAALIHIQRQTLQVLMRLAGQSSAPEATAQKAGIAVAMDIINW